MPSYFLLKFILINSRQN